MEELIDSQLNQLLNDGKFTDAIRLLNESLTKEVEENAYNILSVTVTYFLTHFTEIRKSEELFDILISKVDPEDLLMQLLDHFQELSNNKKFLILLIPLEKVLLKLPEKRLNSFAWGFNVIRVYLNQLSVQHNEDPISNQEISIIYTHVLQFYEPFVEKTVGKPATDEYKVLLANFMLGLLGKSYINLTRLSNQQITEQLVQTIVRISNDIYKFLDCAYVSDFVVTDQVALTNLFYLVKVKEICVNSIPKVYNNTYVLQMFIKVLCKCLDQNDSTVLSNTLDLSENLFNLDKSQLTRLNLDSIYPKHFCERLTSIITLNSEEQIRKQALQIFHTYLFAFDCCGRYLIIKNLMGILNHTSLIGYIITLYKNMISEQLDSKEGISVYFSGCKLFAILNLFCALHAGEESDLVELADQIIATLNLLRYLAIRDKGNVTGIWNYFNVLKNNYFADLKKGLVTMEEHYKLKLKEVEAGGSNWDSSVSVTVAGQCLNDLSSKEKIDIINSTFTSLHMIRSLLCRLEELITLQPNNVC